MYLGFYNLTKNPFHITPDPEFFFLSSTHREAWASIIYGVEEKKGFIAITGEVGVGKTTVLRSYLEGRGESLVNTIYVFNSNLSFQELLRLILREMSVVDAGGSVPEMVERLHLALIDEYTRNRSVILVIDEAQNMPIDTLENLRMLSNLETSKDKLIQIILVGQPEFERMLGLKELRQLTQRMAIRSEIKPLTRKESLSYIAHRLKKAGQESTSVFSKAALDRIAKESKGIPRIINIVCDNALITGFGYQKKPVTRGIVREVLNDLKITRSRPILKWSMVSLLVSLLASVSYFAATAGPTYVKHILKLKQAVFSSVRTTQEAAIEDSSSKTTPLQGEGASVPTPRPLRAEAPASSTPPMKILKAVPPLVIPADEPASGVEDNTAKAGAAAATQAGIAKAHSSEASQEASSSLTPQAPTPPTLQELPLDTRSESLPIPAVHESKQPQPNPTPTDSVADLTIPLDTSVKKPESETAPDLHEQKTTVAKGDFLTKLIRGRYGFINRELIELVKENNPHIKDVDVLHVGDEICLPQIKEEKFHRKDAKNAKEF